MTCWGRIPKDINEIDAYLARYGEHSSLRLTTKDAKWKTGSHCLIKSRFKDRNGKEIKLHRIIHVAKWMEQGLSLCFFIRMVMGH